MAVSAVFDLATLASSLSCLIAGLISLLGCLLTHEGHALVVAGVRRALGDLKQAGVDLVLGDLRAVKLSVNHVLGGNNVRVALAVLPRNAVDESQHLAEQRAEILHVF